jgi:hypothetical protein
MASDLVNLAEDVKTELNTQLSGWGYSTPAVRKNTPTFSLEELGKVRVTVIPVVRAIAKQGRDLLETRQRVDIDIRYRTGNEQATNDSLSELSERIAEHFLGHDGAFSTCIDAESSVVFQTEEMVDKGVFAAAVTLTFLVGRAA